MFIVTLVALCLVAHISGKNTSGYYAVAVLSASIMTFRWSDRSAMPRWLYWTLFTPTIAVVLVVVLYFVSYRIAA